MLAFWPANAKKSVNNNNKTLWSIFWTFLMDCCFFDEGIGSKIGTLPSHCFCIARVLDLFCFPTRVCQISRFLLYLLYRWYLLKTDYEIPQNAAQQDELYMLAVQHFFWSIRSATDLTDRSWSPMHSYLAKLSQNPIARRVYQSNTNTNFSSFKLHIYIFF